MSDEKQPTPASSGEQTQHQQQSTTEVTAEPYVIYQLRKPSQRGRAIIPRFVPNTHAPAFSPANHRFVRVLTHNDPAFPSSSLNSSGAGQHAPLSFEYVGSLGSESSVWSDTSSWVSVSSLRTAPSEVRTPLLTQHHPLSITAEEFFNKHADPANSQPHSHSGDSTNTGSKNAVPIDKSMKDDDNDAVPSALSESIIEDALVDDLLSKAQNVSTRRTSGQNSNKSSRNHLLNNSDNDAMNGNDRVRSRRQSSANRDTESSHKNRSPASRQSHSTPIITQAVEITVATIVTQTTRTMMTMLLRIGTPSCHSVGASDAPYRNGCFAQTRRLQRDPSQRLSKQSRRRRRLRFRLGRTTKTIALTMETVLPAHNSSSASKTKTN